MKKNISNNEINFMNFNCGGKIDNFIFKKETICLHCSADRDKEMSSFESIGDAEYYRFEYKNGTMVIYGVYHADKCPLCSIAF